MSLVLTPELLDRVRVHAGIPFEKEAAPAWVRRLAANPSSPQAQAIRTRMADPAVTSTPELTGTQATRLSRMANRPDLAGAREQVMTAHQSAPTPKPRVITQENPMYAALTSPARGDEGAVVPAFTPGKGDSVYKQMLTRYERDKFQQGLPVNPEYLLSDVTGRTREKGEWFKANPEVAPEVHGYGGHKNELPSGMFMEKLRPLVYGQVTPEDKQRMFALAEKMDNIGERTSFRRPAWLAGNKLISDFMEQNIGVDDQGQAKFFDPVVQTVSSEELQQRLKRNVSYAQKQRNPGLLARLFKKLRGGE